MTILGLLALGSPLSNSTRSHNLSGQKVYGLDLLLHTLHELVKLSLKAALTCQHLSLANSGSIFHPLPAITLLYSDVHSLGLHVFYQIPGYFAGLTWALVGAQLAILACVLPQAAGS